MTAQILDRIVTCHRIGDAAGRFPIFSAEGSRLAPGRWNSPDAPMIYASEHYSTAMLEILVHSGGQMPPNQHFVVIQLPPGISYEMTTKDSLPGWQRADCTISRDHGRHWILECRSSVMFVPSVVARMEWNILINPAHKEFDKISCSLHTPPWWDARLFQP